MPLAALLLASALAASPASKLEEARALAEEFQYDRALRVAEAALLLPDLDRPTLIGLHELVGIAAATLDRSAKARDAFQLLLLIAPEHQLSRNLPPRIRTPYFEARALAERLTPVTLTSAPVAREEGLVRTLEVVVHDVPQLPARAVRFRIREDGGGERVETVPLTPARRAQVAVSGQAVRWTAELLGERGAVLQVVAREELPPPPPAPTLALEPPALLPAAEAPPAPPPTGWLRPTGYAAGGLGLAGLAAGAAFGVLSADARARLAAATQVGGVVTGLTQRQAQALFEQQNTYALMANVGFIAGGVLVATGALLVILGGPPPPATALSVALGPNGLAVSGRF